MTGTLLTRSAPSASPATLHNLAHAARRQSVARPGGPVARRPYGTDITHAREVIKGVADEVWRERSGWVIEEPELWGVEELGPHGVTIRLVIKTQPSRQWDVSRVVRERLKEAFDAEGIEIPFPQQTVWHRRGEHDAVGAAVPGRS